MTTTAATSPPPRDIYTVSRLNRETKLLLEGTFPPLWVDGEISNLSRPSSGHIYFSLKDAQCQIRCAFFRQHQRAMRVTLRDGLRVLVRARVSLYEGRGDFQLVVEYLEEAGEGALRLALEALKQRLAQEGLFDTARKRPLPRLARRIGLVTSLSGAVLHDVVTTLRRRFPAIAVVVYPVPVQGEGAAERIAAAIRIAGERRECDALILARGGGSLEDLWAFNEEPVARAIYACPIPVVSGVGHETDFTLADLVADARAPTPTAAAEMLSPDRNEWLAAYAAHKARLLRTIRDHLRIRSQHLDWIAARLIHPRTRIAQLRARLVALAPRLLLARVAIWRHARTRLVERVANLDRHSPRPRVAAYSTQIVQLDQRLMSAMRRQRERMQERLARAAQGLNALSPLATLERGYALVSTSDGTLVRQASDVRPGERVNARLARGRIECLVEKTHAE
jgi:exodeoxyribonuclease VII large subunit